MKRDAYIDNFTADKAGNIHCSIKIIDKNDQLLKVLAENINNSNCEYEINIKPKN